MQNKNQNYLMIICIIYYLLNKRLSDKIVHELNMNDKLMHTPITMIFQNMLKFHAHFKFKRNKIQTGKKLATHCRQVSQLGEPPHMRKKNPLRMGSKTFMEPNDGNGDQKNVPSVGVLPTLNHTRVFDEYEAVD